MKKPTLEKAIDNIVNYSLAIKSEDRFLIVTDENNKVHAELIIKEAKKKTSHVLALMVESYGKRPIVNLVTELVEDVKMFKPTVAVNYIDFISGEETFRNDIIDELLVGDMNARLAHILALPEKVFIETVGGDYKMIDERGRKLRKILGDITNFKVTSTIGTNLDIELYEKPNWHIESGKYHNQGDWGNLPDGELEILPKSVNGEFVIVELGIFFSARYGVFKENHLKLIIRDSRVEEIITTNDALCKDLGSFFNIDSNSNRIGEFAIGINPFIKEMIGKIFVDEKKEGMHIGFGSPHLSTDEGAFRCATHLDAIGLHSTITAGDKKIMEDDKLLI